MMRPSVLFLALCLLFVVTSAKAQDKDEIGLMPITPSIMATAAKALEGCLPLKGKITGEINKNGVYTLTGELFHNGKTYVVIDDDGDVILCEWQDTSWKPIAALNIQTNWNFPQGYREQEGRSADGTPQPFWMIDLQHRPLLVVASWVEKAGQNYFVVLFDSKCERLLGTESSFGVRPTVKGKYLITGDASRVKSEWEATYFSELQEDKFTETKSWEDSVPWHAEDREDRPDDTSNYASSDGIGYDILPDNSGRKHLADYIVLRSDPKRRERNLYLPGMHGKPFVAVYFMTQKGFTGEEPKVYLFERLTGLPGELYPGYDQLEMKTELKSRRKVKVVGSDKKLVRLLSSNTHQ